MTLSQVESLSEQEMDMVLYIVNVLQPTTSKLEIEPRNLTWFKHKFLVQKIVDVFQQIKPEYHPVYVSLLAKLGVQAQINVTPPPSEPVPPTP